jgi:hypothetical protein
VEPAQTTLLGRPPLQMAYSVPDLREAAAVWARTLGAGPFFLASDGPLPLDEVTCPEGKGAWSHTSCLGQWGPLLVELMEHHSAEPASLADQLGVNRYGLHHVAVTVPDPSSESARLVALGCPVIVRSGTGGVEFIIHDASSTLGCRLEIIERTPGLIAFNDALRRAASGWDGSDPLRPIRALELRSS